MNALYMVTANGCCSSGWGIPLHVWLMSVNRLLMLAAWQHDIYLRHVLSIVTFYGLSISQDITLTEIWFKWLEMYRQTSDISHTLVGHKLVDHSDVVGATPVTAAPNTSSFATQHLASMDWAKTTARRDKNHFSLWFDAPYIRDFAVYRRTT